MTFTWTPTSGLEVVTMTKLPSARWNQAMENLDAAGAELGLPAALLREYTPSPTLGLVGGTPYWSCADGADQSVIGGWRIPPGWASAVLALRWANLGAGSGDVRWNVTRDVNGDGDAINSGHTAVAVTVAAQAQNVVEESTLVTAFAVTPGKTLSFVLTRLGSDGADTLGNAAGIVSVDLLRAT